MAINLVNFLASLAAAMAGAADPDTPVVQPARDLWVMDVNEAYAQPQPAAHAVLRPYGGPPPEEMQRIDNLSLQLAAYSTSTTAAMGLAWQLYNALHGEPDDNGDVQPQNAWAIPGKTPSGSGLVDDDATSYWVYLIVLQAPPGLVGRDERGFNQVTFNFTVRFAAVPLS